ncbi:glycogen/starch/alpha-glucan phosphorylase, partial [Klebsiella pneumoniae]|nr:glycogen/starch/alpha-glucan phosphorylase [Klebsiella pneumoniae]
FYLFGAVAEEIEESRRIGYHHTFYHQNPAIARVVDSLVSGQFTADREQFAPLHQMLTGADHYCHLLDFDSYCQVQQQA